MMTDPLACSMAMADGTGVGNLEGSYEAAVSDDQLEKIGG